MEARDHPIVETSDATFERDVLRAEVPVLVDFWAPWCGPCEAVTPLLDELVARQEGRIRLAKVNVDENVEAAARCGVLSLPTVLLFVGGRVEERLIGARRRPEYEAALARWV